MNRRGFFGMLLGGFVAVVAPKPTMFMRLRNGANVFFGNGAEYWIPTRIEKAKPGKPSPGTA